MYGAILFFRISKHLNIFCLAVTEPLFGESTIWSQNTVTIKKQTGDLQSFFWYMNKNKLLISNVIQILLCMLISTLSFVLHNSLWHFSDMRKKANSPMDCKLAKRPLIFYSKKCNLDFLMEWHCSLTQGTSWALLLQQNYRLGSSGFTVLQGTQVATVSGTTPTVTAATLLSPSLAKIKAGVSSASSTHSSYLESPSLPHSVTQGNRSMSHNFHQPLYSKSQKQLSS